MKDIRDQFIRMKIVLNLIYGDNYYDKTGNLNDTHGLLIIVICCVM